MEFFIVLVIAFIIITLAIRNLYYICQPNEVLIFAGTTRWVPALGRRVGYRLVKGGSSLRMPLFERVLRLDLTNMIIELKVVGAYSKGGIPLKVEGVANIKIAGEEPIIHNAIERLLGKTRDEIQRIAKETLEGNLRGVLASLTPQQVNEDKLAFVRSLQEEAEEDLGKLGLVLDTLQIQNISDDVGYLDSLGRKQRAELLRDARIAEAQAQAQAAIQAAENARLTTFAKLDAEMEIIQAEVQRRIRDAVTRREALVAEVQAEVGAQLARTQADLAVQRERITQVRQQLQADVIAPAQARCQQEMEAAQAAAAQIVEDGKALVEGMRQLAMTWQQAGAHARQIFLLQKLAPLLQALAATVPPVQVERVTVLDPASASSTAAWWEQVQAATGIDLKQLLPQKSPPPES
ncbi:MAG: SPFH domain-containing protein [Gloeomargarita sp. SKYBB_i_bin120]|nr:SPFH domain-containing protein [Gloeomargarita sp. SKYB120]MDW8177242.1 SPFH domain-containing protein [Gloeomargarita sp. SKYBB_i_bin120]